MVIIKILNRLTFKVSSKQIAVGQEKLVKDKNLLQQDLLNTNMLQSNIEKTFPIVGIKNEQDYQEFLFTRQHRIIPLGFLEGYMNFGVITHSLPKGRGLSDNIGFEDTYIELLSDDGVTCRFLILYKAKLHDFVDSLYEGNKEFGPSIDNIKKDIDLILSIKNENFSFLVYDYNIIKKQRNFIYDNIESNKIGVINNSLNGVLQSYIDDNNFQYFVKMDSVKNISYMYDNKKLSVVLDDEFINCMLISSSHWIDVCTRLADITGDSDGFIFDYLKDNLKDYSLVDDKLFDWDVSDNKGDFNKFFLDISNKIYLEEYVNYGLSIDNSNDVKSLLKNFLELE